MLVRWLSLRHQVRVTLISMAASTVVLGLVLYMTGFLLRRSTLDTADREMRNWAAGFLRRNEDRPMQELVSRLQHPGSNQPNDPRANTPRTGNGSQSSGATGTAVPRGRGGQFPGQGRTPDRGPDARPQGSVKESTPPPRRDPPHVTFALYKVDGTPIEGALGGRELSPAEKAAYIPEQLSNLKLPAFCVSRIEEDPIGRFKVLFIYDAQDEMKNLAKVNLALLFLWPVLVAVLTLATYFAVGSSFQPLSKLLAQAERLGIEDRLHTGDQAEFGRLAASINSYLDRIQAVVQQQEEFAVDAAHELCTPLTVLRGQLELALLQRREPAKYAEVAQNAIAQVGRLERLVESLLLAARPRDGVVAPCAVDQAVEEVQARWVDRYATHAVTLDLSAEPFKASMPVEEIDSVLENLLANALKFSPAGTTVKISLGSDGQLVVQDQGPGIAEEDRERVFERFERGTKKGRGFGIGLYLARRLLEQRGGAIRIGDSQLGTRVEVRLPA